MPAVLDAAVEALAAAAPSIVSLPMPYSGDVPTGYQPFHLYGDRGHRELLRALTIAATPSDLLAMFGGAITSLGPGTDVGLPRQRGEASVVYRTKTKAILLTVDPAGPVLASARRAADALVGSSATAPARPGHPLDLPPPHYVVYESADLELADDLAQAPHVEVFEGLPKDFPESSQTFDDLPDAATWGPRLALIARLLRDDEQLEAVIIAHLDIRETVVPDPSGPRGETFKDELVARASAPIGTRVRTVNRGSDQLLYLGNATDDATRAPNRRVEIIVRRRAPGAAPDDTRGARAPTVAAGAVIGRTDGPCAVTVLSEIPVPVSASAPRHARIWFHDPLDVVRRYDTEERFAGAWRGWWPPIGVTSGWVRVLVPPGVDDAAGPGEAPFFSFLALDPAPGGGAPVITDAHLDGLEAGDIVWLPEVPDARCALTIDRPVAIVGAGGFWNQTGRQGWLPDDDENANYEEWTTLRPVDPTGSSGATGFEPAVAPPRLVTFRDLQDPDGIGVRLLGLRFFDGPGGGVSVEGQDGAPVDVRDGTRPNVHVAVCAFVANQAPGPTDGGGLLLADCGGVLVDACLFSSNGAQHGGGLFARSCGHLVVQGAPLTGALGEAFERRRLDALPPPGSEGFAESDLLGSGDLEADGLDRTVTGAAFRSNRARGGGGAVAFVNTRFHLGDVWFWSNDAGGMGGALAASQIDAEVARARRDARPGVAWPRCDRSAVVRCLSYSDQSHSDGGGAFALVGPSDGLPVITFGPALGPDGARDLPGSADDGGFCHLERNLILRANSFLWSLPGGEEDLPDLGGGVLLVGGVYHLRGNRIHGNAAARCGGAVAALAGAQVFLQDNLVDHNLIPSMLPEPGVVGGGALYAHGAAGEVPTRVWLSGNELRDNNRVREPSGLGVVEVATDGDGGAVLGACGSVVVCRRAPGSTPNRFVHNLAAWNGGAIAMRNAELEIGAGEAFQDNRAETGDGGAIFVAGTRTGPAGIDVYQASVDAMLAPPCGRGGSRLAVEGTEAEPVVLQGNVAAQEGGAISVYQRPVLPIVPPAPDAPRSTVVDRTVGLVQSVALRHVRLSGNVSGEPPPLLDPDPPIGGSTIVLQDLDQGWRAAFDGLVFRAPSGEQFQGAEERDRWFGADVLRQHVLEDVQVELDGGVGVLLVRSDRVDLAGLSVTHAGGEPEGSTWLASQSVDVVRPVEP